MKWPVKLALDFCRLSPFLGACPVLYRSSLLFTFSLSCSVYGENHALSMVRMLRNNTSIISLVNCFWEKGMEFFFFVALKVSFH